MDYNALGLANDVLDNHKQSYDNVKDQEISFQFNVERVTSCLKINNHIIIIIFCFKVTKILYFPTISV